MKSKVLWAGIASIAAVAIVAAIMFLTTKPALHGAVIDPPLAAAEIQLQDFNGHPFSLSALRGKVVVLYFGYTNCPDECPLTMAHLKQATDLLAGQSNAVQVIMISTDPRRDTPQALKDFLGQFSPDFLGLSGTDQQLAQVWRDYGVTVEDGGETHSFFVYVIDRAGNFRETFLPDSEPADMAADLHWLATQK